MDPGILTQVRALRCLSWLPVVSCGVSLRRVLRVLCHSCGVGSLPFVRFVFFTFRAALALFSCASCVLPYALLFVL